MSSAKRSKVTRAAMPSAERSKASRRRAAVDALAFDMDHTLIHYNAEKMFPLVYHALGSYLSTIGYEIPAFRLDFCQKGLCFDCETGDWLKLSSSGFVMKAMHGFNELSSKEIRFKYPNVWKHFDRALVKREKESGSYLVFCTYFDMPACPLVAAMVDQIDARDPPRRRRSYRTLVSHLYQAFEHAYRQEAFKEKTGGFFPPIIEDPFAFVRKETEIASFLKKSRAKGLKILLMTNSFCDFSHFLMCKAFGNEWRSLFDVAVSNCNKPEFFTSCEPFALSVPESSVEEPIPPSEIDFAKHFLARGSVSALSDGIDLKDVLYFGDHFHGDVFPLKNHETWHACAVVEELFTHEDVAESREFLDGCLWGSFWGDGDTKTHWHSKLLTHAEMCIPSIRALATDVAPNPEDLVTRDGVCSFYPHPPQKTR